MQRGVHSRPRSALAVLTAFVAALLSPPAHADWQEDIGTFRVGLVAEAGAGNTVDGLAKLTDSYTKALGVKVEFFVARDYADLIDAQAASQIEYAVYSATAYATAFERCKCVEPLVAPVGGDNSIGIRSVLIARTAEPLTLADIGKRRVAILPPDSVAGYQLPLSTLSLPGGPFTGAESFLVQADSALAAETMLVAGTVDAIFGWVPAAAPGQPEHGGGTMARLEAAGLAGSDLTVVWKSDVLRYGPHAVRSDLDPEPKRLLQMFLTGLRGSDPELYERVESHHLGGFAPVSQADYGAAFSIVRMLAAKAVPD